MAVRLEKRALQQAKRLIQKQRFVADERDAWSEHQPSTLEENEFIRQHGFEGYAKWHLGVDTEEPKDVKRRYKFPYGDFVKVHRCGVISAESRAGQYKHYDIEAAAAQLHAMIDRVPHPAVLPKKPPSRSVSPSRRLKVHRR